jgi:hypothetical protein
MNSGDSRITCPLVMKYNGASSRLDAVFPNAEGGELPCKVILQGGAHLQHHTG